MILGINAHNYAEQLFLHIFSISTCKIIRILTHVKIFATLTLLKMCTLTMAVDDFFRKKLSFSNYLSFLTCCQKCKPFDLDLKNNLS